MKAERRTLASLSFICVIESVSNSVHTLASRTTEKLESGLDLMLGSGDNSSDGGASEQGPPKEIAPF